MKNETLYVKSGDSAIIVEIPLFDILKSFGQYHSQMKLLRTEPKIQEWIDNNIKNYAVKSQLPECELGCTQHTCGSTSHIKECKNYADSMQSIIDTLKAENELLKSSGSFSTYKTNAGESVSGIALRQLGNEDLWKEISRLNSNKFPEMYAHDYYPVGTNLVLPSNKDKLS